MNKATQFIQNNRELFQGELSSNGGLIGSDNQEIHEAFEGNGYSLHQWIAGQETWSFNDCSYITRNGDEYWEGDDVADFESQYE